MGETEINQFLLHLAIDRKVAASTQNQALCAIIFMYKHLLKKDIGDLGDITWAKKPKRLPKFFLHEEVQDVIDELSGVYWMMGPIAVRRWLTPASLGSEIQ